MSSSVLMPNNNIYHNHNRSSSSSPEEVYVPQEATAIAAATAAAPPLADIELLNALGVDECEQGNLQEAAKLFSKALSSLSWCGLDPLPIGQEASAETTGMSVYSMAEGCLDPKEHEFVCHPYLFQCPPQQQQQQDSQDVPVPLLVTSEQHGTATICAWFNLGMCFHLEWQASSKTALLVKALHCYEQALAMYSSSLYLTTDPEDPVLQVLMGVCANATHCHVVLGNVAPLHVWNRTLCQILHFCHPAPQVVVHVQPQSFTSASSAPVVPQQDMDMEEEEDEYYEDDEDSVEDDEQPQDDTCAEGSMHHYYTMHAFFNSFPRVAASAA